MDKPILESKKISEPGAVIVVHVVNIPQPIQKSIVRSLEAGKNASQGKPSK